MHDINLIRENKDEFIKAMENRFIEINIERIINLDKTKRNFTFELQELQNLRNKLS